MALKNPAPETIKIVNPKYRRLDQKVRKTQGELNCKLAEVGALKMPQLDAPNKALESFQESKAALDETTDELKNCINKLSRSQGSYSTHHLRRTT